VRKTPLLLHVLAGFEAESNVNMAANTLGPRVGGNSTHGNRVATQVNPSGCQALSPENPSDTLRPRRARSIAQGYACRPRSRSC